MMNHHGILRGGRVAFVGLDGLDVCGAFVGLDEPGDRGASRRHSRLDEPGDRGAFGRHSRLDEPGDRGASRRHSRLDEPGDRGAFGRHSRLDEPGDRGASVVSEHSLDEPGDRGAFGRLSERLDEPGDRGAFGRLSERLDDPVDRGAFGRLSERLDDPVDRDGLDGRGDRDLDIAMRNSIDTAKQEQYERNRVLHIAGAEILDLEDTLKGTMSDADVKKVIKIGLEFIRLLAPYDIHDLVMDLLIPVIDKLKYKTTNSVRGVSAELDEQRVCRDLTGRHVSRQLAGCEDDTAELAGRGAVSAQLDCRHVSWQLAGCEAVFAQLDGSEDDTAQLAGRHVSRQLAGRGDDVSLR